MSPSFRIPLGGKSIRRLAENEAYSMASSPDASLPYTQGESPQLLKSRKRRFEESKRHAVDNFVHRIIFQWPCSAPRTPSEGTVDTNLRCKNAMGSLYPKWGPWYMNWKFKEYLQEISDCLREVPVRGLKLELRPERVTLPPLSWRTGFISVEGIFYAAVPESDFDQIPKPDISLRTTKRDSRAVKRLTEVIRKFEIQTRLPYEHRYLNDLRRSLSNLSKRHDQELDLDQRAILYPLFKQNQDDRTKHAEAVYLDLPRAIIDILTRKTGDQVLESVKLILEHSSYLPTVTPLILLQQLRSSRFSRLPERWKVAIIEYAIAINATQRAKRLVRFEFNPVDLLREVQNPGHEAWEAWDQEMESKLWNRSAP